MVSGLPSFFLFSRVEFPLVLGRKYHVSRVNFVAGSGWLWGDGRREGGRDGGRWRVFGNEMVIFVDSLGAM